MTAVTVFDVSLLASQLGVGFLVMRSISTLIPRAKGQIANLFPAISSLALFLLFAFPLLLPASVLTSLTVTSTICGMFGMPVLAGASVIVLLRKNQEVQMGVAGAGLVIALLVTTSIGILVVITAAMSKH